MKPAKNLKAQLGFNPESSPSVQDAFLKHLVQDAFPESGTPPIEPKEQLVLFADNQIIESPKLKRKRNVKATALIVVAFVSAYSKSSAHSELMTKAHAEPSLRANLEQEINRSQDSNCHLHLSYKLATGSVVEEQVNVHTRSKSQCVALKAKFKTPHISTEIVEKTVVPQWGSQKAKVESPEKEPEFKFKAPYRITNDDCDCELLPIVDSPSEAFGRAMAPLLCGVDFDARAWSSRTPMPIDDTLPKGAAKNFLLRFQKKGGFNPSEHLDILTSILSSSLVNKEPGRVLIALQGLLFDHPDLYEKLMTAYPKLQELSANPPWDCRSEEEARSIQSRGEEFLQRLISRNEQGSTFETWKKLNPLATVLAKIPAARKNIYLDRMSQALAVQAATSELKGIPTGRLQEYAHDSLAPLFGEKVNGDSELFFVRDGSQIRPILLASDPIDEAQSKELGTEGRFINSVATNSTRYGFYSYEFNAIDAGMGEPKEGHVQWKQRGVTYKAHFKLTPGPSKPAIGLNEPSPNYEKLWKDNSLNGLIIVGPALGLAVETTTNQYMRYFLNRGFQFDGKDLTITDSKSYVRDRIAGGDIDYLVKDSHIITGPTQSFLRMAKAANVKVGVRKASGKSETVYIVVPRSNSDLVAVENADMSAWMKKRDSQLVFFDSSCESFSETLRELEQVANKNFVPIAADSCTSEFRDSTSNGLSLLLSAFRTNSTYAEMRAALQLNEKGADGRMDRYVLPDEDLYQQKLLQQTARPVAMMVHITDGSKRASN